MKQTTITKDFKIDRHIHSPSSITNNSSSSSTHSLQRLPEYTAYLDTDTDILDSSSSNPSPSAPYTPDRVPTTPTNTPITQTQPIIVTQPQPISRNLTFEETNSPVSDYSDESLTTPNTQDTSNIFNRPPLPPITTTRSVHIPDPSSVLQYINTCPHKISTATKTKRKTPLPTLPQNPNLPSSSNIPITFLPEPSLKSPIEKPQQYPTPSPSELSSFTFSQLYPKLELQRVNSTTSSLTDLYNKDRDSDSTASTRVPRHSYNLRSQQQRNSQEIQSLTSSSTNSRLLRQHAQPRSDTSSLSSSQPTIPSSLSLPFQITSGFETASLISEDPATISDTAANFSRVYSPSSIASNSSIQLPEYFLEDFSRPPTPNPHEYPIRVNSKIVRTLNEDPRYTVLPIRFINNSSLSTQRKQRELRRLQEQQLTLKFEVEVTFNSLGPHPFSLSTRVAHKTTPSPFIVTSISYLCDADLPEIRTGHINFFNPYSGLNYRTIF